MKELQLLVLVNLVNLIRTVMYQVSGLNETFSYAAQIEKTSVLLMQAADTLSELAHEVGGKELI